MKVKNTMFRYAAITTEDIDEYGDVNVCFLE